MKDYLFMYIYKTRNQKKGGKYVEFRARSEENVLKRVIAEMKAYKGVEARVAIMEYDDDYREFAVGEVGTMQMNPNGAFIWKSSDANLSYRMHSGIVDPKTGIVFPRQR